MDVFITKCKRPTACSHCPDIIYAHEDMVIGILWKAAATPDGKKRRYVFHWHIARPGDGACCWVEAGLIALGNKTQEEIYGAKRRRTPLDLTAIERTLRTKLLRRHGSVLQRIRFEVMNGANEGNFDKLVHLGGLLNNLREATLPVGGVPESWN